MARCILHCILHCAALRWAVPDWQRQPEASQGQSDRHAHILPVFDRRYMTQITEREEVWAKA